METKITVTDLHDAAEIHAADEAAALIAKQQDTATVDDVYGVAAEELQASISA